MASTLSEVNSAHNVIQESGLHFVINQTQYSTYINIRRKFTAHRAYDDTFQNSETVTDESSKHEEESELLKKKYEKISKYTGCPKKN